ncbi:MAG TPA: lytic murein transglycosylase [Candidatus Binatia bacterium]|nr:lytic murein transglycosylase [Candidatus Binatia bacterium]
MKRSAVRVAARAAAIAFAASAIGLGRAAPEARADRGAVGAWDAASQRGWGYMIEKLSADGLDRQRVSAVFADPRFPEFTGLRFSLAPREPRALYRRFLTSASVAQARLCRARYADALDAAEDRHGVAASVVAAILHVETGCGRNTGSSRILPALARLAMAAEPANLAINIEANTGSVLPASAEDARPTVARARRLEEMFYPEVRATLELADRLGVDPLEIRGSGSGAFGIPQFLPTSYMLFGNDGNGDGRVSLYDPEDAIASCAAYLQGHGWHRGLTLTEKRQVIWHYNHSPAYVDTVLSLANRIDAPARTVVQVAKRTTSGKGNRAVAKAHVGTGAKSAHAKSKAKAQPAPRKTASAAATGKASGSATN